MISFNPGPSTLHLGVERWLLELVRSGYLSLPHRSEVFRKAYQRIKQGFIERLDMPADYMVLLVSSATEAWMIITRSLSTVQRPALHLTTGTFSERWYNYAKQEIDSTLGVELSPLREWDFTEFIFPVPLSGQLLCVTHTETSNGSMLPPIVWREVIPAWQKGGGLVAVDATTAMAGLTLNWALGDIWFASVQKCFGLPPGLGVMVISPRAVEAALALKAYTGYNSLTNLIKHAQHFETTHTPNLTNIYLLAQLLSECWSVGDIHRRLARRQQQFYEHFPIGGVEPYITPPENRAITVFCLTQPDFDVLSRLSKQGYLLGEGYGQLKAQTFRIANFPAVPDAIFFTMCEALVQILRKP